MWEFLPSSVEIIYRNQLSGATQFKVGIPATVAFTLQKAGLSLFAISFFFLWVKKKKTPVPEIWILNMCGPPCFLLQTCREATIPISRVSSSCEFIMCPKNAKGGAVSPVCPLPATVFQDGA